MAYVDVLEVAHGPAAVDVMTFDPPRNWLPPRGRPAYLAASTTSSSDAAAKGPTLRTRRTQIVPDEAVDGVWPSDHSMAVLADRDPAVFEELPVKRWRTPPPPSIDYPDPLDAQSWPRLGRLLAAGENPTHSSSSGVAANSPRTEHSSNRHD
jgi:hypothetical protein